MPDWLRHIIVFPFVIIVAAFYLLSDGILLIGYLFAVIFWLIDGQSITKFKEFKQGL